MYIWSTALRLVDRLSRTHRSQTMNSATCLREHTSLPSEDDAFKQWSPVPHHLAIEAMESKEEEEGSQRSLSGSPGPTTTATATIEGEEALGAHCCPLHDYTGLVRTLYVLVPSLPVAHPPGLDISLYLHHSILNTCNSMFCVHIFHHAHLYKLIKFTVQLIVKPHLRSISSSFRLSYHYYYYHRHHHHHFFRKQVGLIKQCVRIHVNIRCS